MEFLYQNFSKRKQAYLPQSSGKITQGEAFDDFTNSLFNEAFLTEHEACFTHEVASLMKRALRHIRNASLNESALEDLLHDGCAVTSYLLNGKYFIIKLTYYILIISRCCL